MSTYRRPIDRETRGLSLTPQETLELRLLQVWRTFLESTQASGRKAFTNARKRAFRRARRRAEQNGGTEYRGRWRTARELGTTCLHPLTETAVARNPKPAQRMRWTAQPRLRICSYNVGGVTSEVYDVLHRWLTTRCTDDIVVLQELHWGCGKQDTEWTIPGWTVVVTADAAHLYSGVGIFVSNRIASADQISSHTWIAARLLHVRCSTARLTLDVVGGYQWVWQGDHQQNNSTHRSSFWCKLSELLQGLPARNMVAVCMDANTPLHPVPGLVGRGVMRTTRHRDQEFEAMLQALNLVVLNSWTSASPQQAHTFSNGPD